MSSTIDVLGELLPTWGDQLQANALVGTIDRGEPVSGGSISDTRHVWLSGGQQIFVKSNAESFLSNFQAEERGLAALYEATRGNDDLWVAQPLAVAAGRSRAWLVMDWIESSLPADNFHQRFGRGLAKLHRSTLKDGTSNHLGNGCWIGWESDNFLGSARQVNTRSDDWPAFFAEHRIGYQIRWAVDQGMADRRLVRDCETIAERMATLLAGRQDATSLLHGDLWSGNYLAGSGGAAVIIDPAVYYGCREAEFGMLKLFGGCRPAFYQAYEDEFPMADGWQNRVSVYVLYHLLNHLNLFGRGYLSQCHQVAGDILRIL